MSTPDRLVGHPGRLTAGDTWAWDYDHPRYPVGDGYTFSFALAGPSVLPWATTYVDTTGGLYAVTIPAAITQPILPGVYRAWALFLLSSDRYTVPLADVVVIANPALAGAGDYEDWAERTLAVLKARIEGRVDADVLNYELPDGRRVEMLPMQELWSLRARLTAEITRRRRRGRPRQQRLYFSAD